MAAPEPSWTFAGAAQQYSSATGGASSSATPTAAAAAALESGGGGGNSSGGGDELRALYLGVHGVVMPVVSLVGIVSNVANLVVLADVAKRYRTSLYQVLLAIAAADLLLMAVVLVRAARFEMRAHPITRSDEADLLDAPSYFFYHTWDTFANICGMASNWCVVAVMGMRLVAIHFPLLLRAPSAAAASGGGRRPRAAAVALPIVFVVAVGVNLPWALVKPYDRDSGRFVLQKELHNGYKRDYYVVLLLLYHVIPWIAMASLAGCLLLSVRSQRWRSRGGGGEAGGCVVFGAKVEQGKKEAQRTLSATLAGKAAWFVASTAPIVAYYFALFAAEDEDLLAERPSMQAFYIFAHVLALTNYAANFFLYTFLNLAYRRRLASLLCCRRRRRRRESSAAATAAADAEVESNAGCSTTLATTVSDSVELRPLKLAA